ncbi:MAG: DUF484 family protein [Alphaproteobacteria bacterium]|nr:DUF484 family protein [Alphaproteobacteria bacterium]NCQ89073.1 DUF484 family protein [Alphaproteobacteria bacterium]NCT07973.1 DUF484 family protein [Alphaproteobacteria bacterium]
MSDSQEVLDMPSDKDLHADDILDYLRANPKFLQQNPQACDLLVLPKTGAGKDGKKIADFQSFMIERLKNDKEKVLETTQAIVENARSNMNNQQRIHAVVLRLLEARNFEEFISIITMDMSQMLNTDIAVFVVESNGQDIPHIHTTGIRVLPEGTIDKWMNGQNVLLQSSISGIEPIYGGGANLVQSQALLRIDIAMDTPPAILAFGSRDPNMFSNGQATDLIAFLARVVERSFRSWLS